MNRIHELHDIAVKCRYTLQRSSTSIEGKSACSNALFTIRKQCNANSIPEKNKRGISTCMHVYYRSLRCDDGWRIAPFRRHVPQCVYRTWYSTRLFTCHTTQMMQLREAPPRYTQTHIYTYRSIRIIQVRVDLRCVSSLHRPCQLGHTQPSKQDDTGARIEIVRDLLIGRW